MARDFGYSPLALPSSNVMSSVCLRNARLINEGQASDGDLLIEDERIAAVGSGFPVPSGVTEIDLAGDLLIPGVIDDQVHFREPGLTHKGCIATESRAAVAGGITSFMEMPNCRPQTINEQAVRDKLDIASRDSMANYAFYFGATNDNLEAIKRIGNDLVCGVKVFMGASTGNMLVNDPATLEGIFAGTDLVIATHCEDTPMIEAAEQRAFATYGEDIPFREHVHIRSDEACFASSSLAVELARKKGSKLHVLHLTSASELALFDAGPVQDKRITVEVCGHHLFFNESWYDRKGSLIKCNPSIKTREDQQALIAALREDRIDIIATDHAPHTWEEKQATYRKAPAGLPLAQHNLLIGLELVQSGELDLPNLVNKMCHAPALRFGVKDRGFLREGYFADLVRVSLDAHTEVDEEPVHARCGWTPFAGVRFRARVLETWVNGATAWSETGFATHSPARKLEFACA